MFSPQWKAKRHGPRASSARTRVRPTTSTESGRSRCSSLTSTMTDPSTSVVFVETKEQLIKALWFAGDVRVGLR